jgi:hypothetical protein
VAVPLWSANLSGIAMPIESPARNQAERDHYCKWLASFQNWQLSRTLAHDLQRALSPEPGVEESRYARVVKTLQGRI